MDMNTEYDRLWSYRRKTFDCLTKCVAIGGGGCFSCDLQHKKADLYTKFLANFNSVYMPVRECRKIYWNPSDAELLVLILEYPKLVASYLEAKAHAHK